MVSLDFSLSYTLIDVVFCSCGEIIQIISSFQSALNFTSIYACTTSNLMSIPIARARKLTPSWAQLDLYLEYSITSTG